MLFLEDYMGARDMASVLLECASVISIVSHNFIEQVAYGINFREIIVSVC